MSLSHTYDHSAIGYRAWQLTEDYMLLPLRDDCPAWRPGVNTAYCLQHHHIAPAPRCQCGFNAYYTLDHAFEGSLRAPYDVVLGAIAACGDLEVHSIGFRCEQAQIVGLVSGDETLGLMPDIDPNHVHAIAERYQVPVFDSTLELEDHSRSLPGTITVPVDLHPTLDQGTITPEQPEDSPVVAAIIMALLATFSIAWLVAFSFHS